jgi:hypothetical protein
MVNTKKLNPCRNEIMDKVRTYLESEGYTVLVVASNGLALEVVGEDMEEGWVKAVFSIPTGTRGGEDYDGYAESSNYAFEVEQKRIKAEEAEKKKAKKMAKDAEKRKAKEEKAE